MNGLVVPCFNEEKRLVRDEIAALVRDDANLTVLLVDDGSTDQTVGVLNELARVLPRVEVLALEKNGGKAEAVRRGLRHLAARGCRWVGFADADFSTPAAEIRRLFALADDSPALALLGARVKLLGTDIERRAARHYLGRVFATFASLALDLPVYDTQCGAKVFRVGAELDRCLARTFASRWAFDVELIGRLNRLRPHALHQTFREVPLATWRDVGGSKLGARAMIRAGLDLIAIAYRLRANRRT